MFTEILFERSVEKNTYIIDISMEKLEDGKYAESIRNYGEEPIEIGGEVRDEYNGLLATLSNRQFKISELPAKPIRQQFPESQYGEKAKEVALCWYEQVKETINAYIASKVALYDDFSASRTIEF